MAESCEACKDVGSFSKLNSEAPQLGEFITGDLVTYSKRAHRLCFCLFISSANIYLLLPARHWDRPRGGPHADRAHFLMAPQ